MRIHLDWADLALRSILILFLGMVFSALMFPIAVLVDLAVAEETELAETQDIQNFQQDEDEYMILTPDGKVNILAKKDCELFITPDDSRVEFTTTQIDGWIIQEIRTTAKIYAQREIVFGFR